MTESSLIPAADAGIQLYLREKRPADLTQFRSDRILLFVHGATYPAETAFDLPLGGVSMMEWIAQRGLGRPVFATAALWCGKQLTALTRNR